MKRLLIAAGLCLALPASPGRADDAPAPPPLPACSVSSVNILALGKGDISIGCSGVSEAFANQLADIMTRILQNRLDPQMVLAKLDEVSRVPEENVARVVDDRQRQQIIQSLLGKPPAQVAILAHPVVTDSADFARGIATALLQVGWQIEGQQIRRAAPKLLDPVTGVAIVVRDQNAPPTKAVQLKAALAAANIAAPVMSDPTMAADAAILWVGRRPEFSQPDAPK